MKKTAILLAALFFFAVIFAQVASTQQLANVAGSWDVTIRMPDRNISEHWTILQNGDKITGTVKATSGELPLAGTIDAAGFFRVQIKDGDMQDKVRATVDKDSMDGSILIGKKEYLWSAKRSKSS